MSFLTLPIVVDAVAKASLILAVTALTAAALRRASASARHLIWTLGLLSALAAPALSLALPRWELPIVTLSPGVPPDGGAHMTASGGNDIRIATPARRVSIAPAPRVTGAHDGVAAAPAVSLESRVRAISWTSLALFAWIAGATLVLGRMFVGLIAVQWMSRRLPEIDDAPWLDEAHALAWTLELRGVRFLRGAEGTMPMAWGILRPSVVMPVDADNWPAHRLRVVLLHELAHVKRRDCLTHLVAQLTCAAYWFNPLAWMAARRLRTERERACDDLVLAAGTRGSDYADQLLDIARVMRAGRFPAVLAGASLAMAQRSQLEGRLMAILDPSVPRSGLTRARATAAALVFAVVILSVASVQPWAKAVVNAPTADAGLAQNDQTAVTTQTPKKSDTGTRPRDARQRAAAEERASRRDGRDMSQEIAESVSAAVGGIVGGVAGG